jgi:hypothetical protein
MTTSSKLLFAAATSLLLAAPAAAQKGAKGKVKPPPPAVRACGINAIPLSEGNSWTYEPVAYPFDQLKIDKSKQPTPDQLKLLPQQPKKVVITVTKVDATKDGATITLEEDVDDRKLTTQLACTASTLTVSSTDAFWFAGDAGGGWNQQIDITERKNASFPIVKGDIQSPTNEWHDDVKATWKRIPTQGVELTPDLGSGTFSLERHFVYTADENISVKSGQYTGAHRIGLEVHGQITIDGADGKPAELPEGLVTWYWVADGVGPIEIGNSFFHAYQLTAVTIK